MYESTDPHQTTVTQFEPRDDERVTVHHHWDPDDPDTVVLSRLFVEPDARRQGLGTAVLDALKYVFYEEGAVTLEVRSLAGPGAITFLKDNEFVIDSYEERVDRDYEGRIDRVQGEVVAHFDFRQSSEGAADDEVTTALDSS